MSNEEARCRFGVAYVLTETAQFLVAMREVSLELNEAKALRRRESICLILSCAKINNPHWLVGLQMGVVLI